MINARTYAVGESGEAKRLNDLTGTWVPVSPYITIPAAIGLDLNDVETDPNDGDKVFVVGKGRLEPAAYGIYVSSDGGQTWTQPSGNYITNWIQTPQGQGFLWTEVTVVNSFVIYVSGQNGYVAKSVDGGLSFNLCTQIPPTSACQFPVGACPPIIQTAHSVHFITPLIGVVGLVSNVAKTVDGGVTWSILNGGGPIFNPISTASALKIKGVYLSSNQQTIVALGEIFIATSVDGGLTFTSVHTWTRNGIHLTWTDDLNLWAFGADSQRLYSTDIGQTWSAISAYSPNTPDHHAGHFYLAQNGYFSTDNKINVTNNGSNSFTLSGTLSKLVYAIWTWYQPQCYTLTDCEGNVEPFDVTNDLSALVGQVIKLCPGDIPETMGNYGSGDNGLPIPVNPNDPGTTSYTLFDCCNIKDPVVITNNLGPYENGIIHIPSLGDTCWNPEKGITQGATSLGLVNISGAQYYNTCSDCVAENPCVPVPEITDCVCFEVTEAEDCNYPIELVNTGTEYTDCPTCLQTCFYLKDCEDPDNIILTSDDFSQYAGTIVVLQDCPDKCWEVSEAEFCDSTAVCVAPVINSFPTCEECLPPVLPPPPVNLIQRAVKPGYYTPGCDTEYTEKVNCKFGDGSYNQMISVRYGIEYCCEEDSIKWDIKKNLLEYQAIYNPEWDKAEKTCYCYTITQTVNSVQYKYIDCEGCWTTLILAEGETQNVCSQNYPKAVCPPVDAVYEITPSDILCLTTEDCIPTPPPSCFCYTIDPKGSAIKPIISYTRCSDGEVITTEPFGNILYICAIADSINVVQGTPTITGGTNVCENDEPTCLPCTCYQITSYETTSIIGTGCDNLPYDIQVVGAQGVYVCSKTFPQLSGRGVVKTLSGIECSIDKDCEQDCYCYSVDASLGEAQISYIDCSGEVQIVFASNELIKVCAQRYSITFMSGTVTPSIIEIGQCPCPADCFCYRVIALTTGLISYTECNGTVVNLTINYPQITIICAQLGTPEAISGDISFIQLLSTPCNTTACIDYCYCFSFLVPLDAGTAVVNYYRCTDGALVSNIYGPGIHSICAKQMPTSESPIVFIEGNQCTGDGPGSCPIQCGCYRISNTGIVPRNITITNCDNFTFDVLVLPNIDVYYCATSINNPFPDVFVEVQGFCDGTSICETAACPQNCCCFQVNVNSDGGTALVSWTDCTGQSQASTYTNGSHFFCAQAAPTISNNDGTVNLLGNCASVLECNV